MEMSLSPSPFQLPAVTTERLLIVLRPANMVPLVIQIPETMTKPPPRRHGEITRHTSR